MNPPSVDIKDILTGHFVSDSSGYDDLELTFGTNLFVDQEPDKPDVCVTIYDTGGFDRIPGIDYEQPTVQIRSRANQGGYLTAYSNLKTICDYLHELTKVDLSQSKIIAIWQMGDIIRVGSLDETRRPALTVNFRIHRTTQSGD